MFELICILLADSNLLNRLLIFVAGLENIPLLGFFPQPQIMFGHLADFREKDTTGTFPLQIHAAYITIASLRRL